MPLSGFAFQGHYSIIAYDYCMNLMVFHHPKLKNNRSGLFYLIKTLPHSLLVEDSDKAPMKFKDRNHFFVNNFPADPSQSWGHNIYFVY